MVRKRTKARRRQRSFIEEEDVPPYSPIDRARRRNSNRPQFKLKLTAQRNDDEEEIVGRVVGVGWVTRNGKGINIKMNRGSAITWRDCEDGFITLWPYDYEE